MIKPITARLVRTGSRMRRETIDWWNALDDDSIHASVETWFQLESCLIANPIRLQPPIDFCHPHTLFMSTFSMTKSVFCIKSWLCGFPLTMKPFLLVLFERDILRLYLDESCCTETIFCHPGTFSLRIFKCSHDVSWNANKKSNDVIKTRAGRSLSCVLCCNLWLFFKFLIKKKKIFKNVEWKRYH